MREKIIGLKELRENTESYIKQVEKGQSFLIIRRSKPVFRLSPPDPFGDEGTWETVVDFTKISPKGVSFKKVEKAVRSLLKERQWIKSRNS